MITKKSPERATPGLSKTYRGNDSALFENTPCVGILPQGQGVQFATMARAHDSLTLKRQFCPTCHADSSGIVWRDRLDSDCYSHALPLRLNPWCSICDRPWFRWSADRRVWRGAVA